MIHRRWCGMGNHVFCGDVANRPDADIWHHRAGILWYPALPETHLADEEH